MVDLGGGAQVGLGGWARAYVGVVDVGGGARAAPARRHLVHHGLEGGQVVRLLGQGLLGLRGGVCDMYI